MKCRFIFMIIVVFAFSSIARTQSKYTDTISCEIAKLKSNSSLPGFAVAIVNEDGIVYHDAFGYSKLDSEEKYSIHTVQRLGSVSKTLIALCLMKLIEEGKLSLDTEINTILPTPIYNPKFPNTEITVEHLVTHTSGILDDEKMYWNYTAYLIEGYDKKLFPKEYKKIFKKWSNNTSQSLGKYCYSYLSLEGKYYTKKTYADYSPGEFVNYSNLGASLTAYIIELVEEKSFKQVSKELIFKGLELDQSYWSPELVPPDLLAQPYETEDLLPIPNYVDIGYPEGGWHTNIIGLGKYLSEMIRGFKGNSSLLSPNSYGVMMNGRLTDRQLSTKKSKSKANIGIFWSVATNGEIRHDGGFLGASVFMRFNPETGIGKIFMTNLLLEDNNEAINAFVNIWRIMSEYEAQL